MTNRAFAMIRTDRSGPRRGADLPAGQNDLARLMGLPENDRGPWPQDALRSSECRSNRRRYLVHYMVWSRTFAAITTMSDQKLSAPSDISKIMCARLGAIGLCGTVGSSMSTR
jgi:hypothetical protein